MFAPFGKIYDLEIYKGLLEIKECIGAKHYSLDEFYKERPEAELLKKAKEK
jgi:hypothetical protein